MKNAVVMFGILTLSLEGFSQTSDSIPRRDSMNVQRRAQAFAADKFAIARPLNIEFVHVAPYSYNSDKDGKSFHEGRMTGFSQLKVSGSINFVKKKNWALGATLGYRYIAAGADVFDPFTGGQKPVDNDFHYLFSSISFSYFSTLFNKRVIYTSSLAVDGSGKQMERVKGLITGTMILKANQRTKMTAGILVNIDPSAQIPVVPTFSYEHKFNNGFVADFVLPKNLYLRKYINSNARISLGSELDRTSFYLYNIDGTDQKYEYRQLDINSGITFEHIIARQFIFTAKTGMRFSTSGRLFRKEDSFNSPVFQTRPAPAYYFNVGISFNPFTVLGKKK